MPSFTSQIIEHKSRTVCLEDSCPQLVYQIPITCVRIFPGSLIIMSSCQRSPQSVIPNQTFPCQPAFHLGRHRTCNISVTQLKSNRMQLLHIVLDHLYRFLLINRYDGHIDYLIQIRTELPLHRLHGLGTFHYH